LKPATKEIPADHQMPSPAASQIAQTSPVSAVMQTNHSPRMDCLGSASLETSIYHRPTIVRGEIAGPFDPADGDAGGEYPLARHGDSSETVLSLRAVPRRRPWCVRGLRW